MEHKMKTGHLNEADITKQNLYAACLQFEKEHQWAQELGKKIETNSNDEVFLR